MNRKGQALVEFVLILPILILILFAIVDFGNIFHSKYELQNQSADIVKLIINGNNEQEITNIYSNIDIKITDYKTNYKKIVISKKIDLMTPGVNKILGDPYLLEVERVVPNDKS